MTGFSLLSAAINKVYQAAPCTETKHLSPKSSPHSQQKQTGCPNTPRPSQHNFSLSALHRWVEQCWNKRIISWAERETSARPQALLCTDRKPPCYSCKSPGDDTLNHDTWCPFINMILTENLHVTAVQALEMTRSIMIHDVPLLIWYWQKTFTLQLYKPWRWHAQSWCMMSLYSCDTYRHICITDVWCYWNFIHSSSFIHSAFIQIEHIELNMTFWSRKETEIVFSYLL